MTATQQNFTPAVQQTRTPRWYWEVAHPDGMMTAGWARTKVGARRAVRRHGSHIITRCR